jgi:phosphatidylglycerophosphate synthase
MPDAAPDGKHAVRLVLDEPADRWFSRPLARGVVSVLARTPLTPNQVTLVGTLVGIASGVALGLRDGVLFAVLTGVFLVLDCCDGQLARLRGGGGGFLGRAVDGIGDYFTAIAIHIGLACWLGVREGWPIALAWTVAAGASMAWGAGLLDRYKRRFKGEVDDFVRLEAEIAASRGWRRWALAVMLPYMRRLANERPRAELAAYQAHTAWAMRLFLLCGHTTHVTVWSVCALLDAPLQYAWLAVGPFNALALAGVWLQRRGERAAAAW